MPRPLNPIRPRRYDVYCPEDVAARIDMLLYSPAEQRVPKGAISQFFTMLARNALETLEAQQRASAAKRSST
jgi:hypothetical protein